jgi:hypothetical protein
MAFLSLQTDQPMLWKNTVAILRESAGLFLTIDWTGKRVRPDIKTAWCEGDWVSSPFRQTVAMSSTVIALNGVVLFSWLTLYSSPDFRTVPTSCLS